MAKSHSRKGKPGTPKPGAANPSPMDTPVSADDADRTVVLPGADTDPTLTPPTTAGSATTPSVPEPTPRADAATTPVRPETGTAPLAVDAAAAPPRAERKELVGSLRSKEQRRALEKARGKGKEPVPSSAGSGVVEGLKSLLAAVLLFFVIRTFLVTAYSIPSESMEETLLVGDYLMANNALFGATLPFTNVKLPALRDPRRGEIVVFRPTYNEPQIDVVKRVIGTPGDTLQMADGVLFRNGQRVNEPYAHYDQGVDENIELEGFGMMDPNIIPAAYGAKNHLPLLLPGVDPRQYRPSRNTWGPLVVPAGHYWLMGDNRDHSLDSRYMGPIPRRVIRGKPLFIYYSYDRRDPDAAFPSFVTAARWGRIGDRIR